MIYWGISFRINVEVMKQISLHPEGFTLVDDADYDWLNSFYWERHRQGYARLANGNKPRWLMHRLIMNAQPGQFVDHISGDKTDNCRSNLRFATRSQNGGNQRPRAQSGYKGVYWSGHSWQAAMNIDGKRVALGRYKDPVDAARAYDKAAIARWGEFAHINNV